MKFTEEHKRKISEALKGHPISEKTRKVFERTSFKKGMTPWNKGKKCPSLSGSNHWHWKGGISSEVKKRTNDLEWKKLAKSIYERDGWCCQRCEKHIHSNPQCHHIIPYSIFQNNNPNNLITLCASCHMIIEKKWLMYSDLFSAKRAGIGVTII